MATQEQQGQYEKKLLETAPKMLEVLNRAVTWGVSYAKASRQKPPWLEEAKAVIETMKR